MAATPFMFATGIECSYPTIRNGTHRVDELELCDHYRRWREDFALTWELGIRTLRYGPPYYRIHTGPGRYDWTFTDEVLPALRELGLVPVMDLMHFGVPDWLGNSFQNPELPRYFAEYAAAFAARYPWVQYYTPVNEIFIAAKFSALNGWWNEQLQSDRAYVTAIKHLCQASLGAMGAILAVRPDALFIQSESSEYTHVISDCAAAQAAADWENQVRFLALDLLYSHQVRGDVLEYLFDNGITRPEYRTFMTHGLDVNCVLGSDYYVTNERILTREGKTCHVGDVFGWYLVTLQYYERYRKPVMHTETNRDEAAGSVEWLWKQWRNVLEMRRIGVPVLGFTWFSLTDQVDWDTALREPNRRVNPLGLYDLDRNLRPVGTAYGDLIRSFSRLPVVPNSDFLAIVS
jgi:beta-glucosidase/6-phospho-beta-glucosidase/beta-galactosidase